MRIIFFPTHIGAGINPLKLTQTETGVIMELVKIIISILLPPLGVFMQVGLGKHFWLNIILTLLGYIPGIIHAIWVIAKNK